VRIFDENFFEINTGINQLDEVRRLKVKDLFINDDPIDSENLFFLKNIRLPNAKIIMLTQGILKIKNRYFMVPDQPLAVGNAVPVPPLPVNDKYPDICFSSSKKGSKIFRTVLEMETGNYIPHNILKFAETGECLIDFNVSKTLNELWTKNYFDTGTRTFCFKLHNNTLGTNNRVSKFIRGKNADCTFCEMREIPDAEPETILHLFYSCESVETLIQETFAWLLQERQPVKRNDYFGIFTFENKHKTEVLLHISIWIKKYIWDFKQSFTLPNIETLKTILTEKLKVTCDISASFRLKLAESEINIRF